MRTPDDRWAELAAAALAGELTPAEEAEFDDLRRSDPARAAEYADLEGLAGRLRQGDVGWVAPRDGGELFGRIESALGGGAPGSTTTAQKRPRRWVTPVAAAACLVVGVAIGANGAGLLGPGVPSGPPGTLGAVERVAVRDDLEGVDVSAELVAHTWGTEAYLEATGLDVGATYELVFVGVDGAEFSAGEVLGSEVPIVCRMNAAVLRGDAVRIELRGTGEAVVAHAELPAV